MGKTEWVIKVETNPPYGEFAYRFSKSVSDLKDEMRPKMRFQGRRLHRLVQEDAPKRTREFESKIRLGNFAGERNFGFFITTPKPIANFIVGGTKAHPIAARRASMLRFFWPGGFAGAKVYYFKSVMHPGTQPNPFVDRAYKRWLPGAKVFLNELAKNFIIRIRTQ